MPEAQAAKLIQHLITPELVLTIDETRIEQTPSVELQKLFDTMRTVSRIELRPSKGQAIHFIRFKVAEGGGETNG